MEPRPSFEYINIDWWKNFQDELLLKYILTALQNNHSLKAVRYKLNSLREGKNIEISKEFPNISVGANYLGLKIPRYALPFEGFRDNSFALPFVAMWEIDIFGKRKNKIDMARQDFYTAIYEEKGAAIALAAEVAGVYYNILNLNSQIKIQEKILNNKIEKLKRLEGAYNAGVLNTLDLNRIKKEKELEEIVLADYKKQRESFLFNLQFLLGEDPECLKGLAFSNFEKADFFGKIPDCIPSDTTIYRPDILAQEAKLKRAKIDVTLARKQFLPNINVFGVLVFSTLTPNFGWKGAVANILAGATQNIFSGGKRIFALKQKKFDYQKALEDYIEADLKARREINDTLYALKTDIKIYNSSLNSLAFEEDSFIRVSNSYAAGVSAKLQLLDNQNDFLAEKSKNLNIKTQKIADLISLYKAVGGRL